jgi:predicted nucleic acid-binding protein
MTARVFVDTNVFVYTRDTSQGAKQEQARAWVEALWREQSGRTSVQVLNELYVTLTRKLRPGMPAADAWDDVEALLAWSPQPIDAELLAQARSVEQRYGLSWWDSLIVAAAFVQDCDILLSEDLQHGMRFGAVLVRSPFAGQVADDAPTYAKGPAGVARRHRGRGRPRRSTGTA